jgi:hypothetical protein
MRQPETTTHWTGPRAVFVAAVALGLCLYVGDLALSQAATGSVTRQNVRPLAYVPFIDGGGFTPAAEDGSPVLADTAVGEGGADLHNNELWLQVQEVKKGLAPLLIGKRKDSVAFVPARDLADRIGARLRWPGPDKPAALFTGSGVLTVTPGQQSAMLNRRNANLIAAPWVDGEDLQVPLLSICESFGLKADWDEGSHRYTVARKGLKLTVIMESEQFSFEVARSGPWLKVSYAGKLVKQYSICSGEGENTPVGHFAIQNKAEWPPWNAYWGEYMPGGSPRNPLGARWLGTTACGRATGRVIGIHGTNEPSSIGRRISGGCMRCQNHDIIELYEVIPVGTPVWIHE